MDQINGKKIMMLVANGFTQADFITLQRAMMTAQAGVSVVSSEKNLVNGFNGSEWGLTFPVNQQIDSVLGSDFDAVIVVGGEQSVKRLDGNPHTARILESFADAGKPVVLVNEAGKFDMDSSKHVLHIEGDVTDETVEVIISHIVPAADMAKAA